MTDKILATNKNVVATPHAIAGDAGYTLRFASGRVIWVPAAVYEVDFDGVAQPDLSLPENAPVSPTSSPHAPNYAPPGYERTTPPLPKFAPGPMAPGPMAPGPLTSPPKPD
jgi:hypothetical protein